MTPKPAPLPADPTDVPVAPAPQHAPMTWAAPRMDSMEMVRRMALILAMVFLAISLAVAYFSATRIVEIWFDYQYVPIMRLVLALGIAAIAGWVVLRLTKRG